MARSCLTEQHKGTCSLEIFACKVYPPSLSSASFSLSPLWASKGAEHDCFPAHLSDTGVSWAIIIRKVPSPLWQRELLAPENRIRILRPLCFSFNDKQSSASMKGDLQRFMELQNPSQPWAVPSPSATSFSFSPEKSVAYYCFSSGFNLSIANWNTNNCIQACYQSEDLRMLLFLLI